MSIESELNELKEQITPISTIKFLGGTLVGLGATAAVIGMMKSPLGGSKGVTKLLMKLGIFILGCAAGDAAEEYFKKTVDEMDQTFREAKGEMREAMAHA